MRIEMSQANAMNGDEEPIDTSEPATPLCPNCLQEVDPLVYYCPSCGSTDVVNPLASYLPLVELRFIYGGYGKLWRELLYRRMPRWRRVIFALAMAMMAPFTVPLLLIPTLFYGGLDSRPLRWRFAWLALVVCVLVSLPFLAFVFF
jgi:hypothetical protein